MWSNEKMLAAFRRAAEDIASTVERKNADYAGATADAFGNFKLIEALTSGRISAEDGMLVRITDKLARLATLVLREPAVLDESFEDTCYDQAAYSILLALMRRSRTEPDVEVEPASPVDATQFEQLKAFLNGMRRKVEPA